MKPRIYLAVQRASGHCSEVDTGDRDVSPEMLDSAEDLLHTVATGERSLPAGLYDLCASAFGTDREDAKKRLLGAMYGKRGERPA